MKTRLLLLAVNPGGSVLASFDVEEASSVTLQSLLEERFCLLPSESSALIRANISMELLSTCFGVQSAFGAAKGLESAFGAAKGLGRHSAS